MEKYTVKQFDAQFPNDDVCLDFLKAARWPDGVTCAKCQKVTNHYRITGRKVYSCAFCGTQVSPTAGHHLPQVRDFPQVLVPCHVSHGFHQDGHIGQAA